MNARNGICYMHIESEILVKISFMKLSENVVGMKKENTKLSLFAVVVM